MFSPLGGANSVPQIPSMDLRASSSSGKEGKGKKKKQRKGREVKRRKEGRSLSAPRNEYLFTAFVPSVHPPLLTSTFTIKLWLSLQASRYTSVCLTLYYCVLSRRLELVAAPIIYITDVTQTAVRLRWSLEKCMRLAERADCRCAYMHIVRVEAARRPQWERRADRYISLQCGGTMATWPLLCGMVNE